LLDSDLATSVERARRRNVAKTAKAGRVQKDENRFEQENRSFFGRVRNGYLAIERRESERVRVVDARGTPSQTHAKILDVVKRKLRLNSRG
jgi:dTMP kinase